MEITISERKEVYLASREVFTGQKAAFRTKTAAKKEMKANKDTFSSLKHKMGHAKVIAIILELLNVRAFESNVSTEEVFLIVSRCSSKPITAQEINEQEPVIQADDKTKADMDTSPAEHALSARNNDDTKGEEVEPTEKTEAACETASNTGSKQDMTCIADLIEQQQTDGLMQDSQGSSNSNVRTRELLNFSELPLGEVRLPFPAQHLLLSEVQRLLEECCFDFVKAWFPSVLEDQQCDCAMALESNRWSELIQEHAHKIPPHAFKLEAAGHDSILQDIKKLRHFTVHRVKMTPRELQSQVNDGIALASLLKDHSRTTILRSVLADIDHNIATVENMKKVVHSTATNILKDIHFRREALDIEEQLAIAGMEERNAVLTLRMGDLIRKSVAVFLTSPEQPSHGLSEDEDGNEQYHDSAGELIYVDISEVR